MFLNLWVFSQEIFLKSTLPQKLNEGVVKKKTKQKKVGIVKVVYCFFFRSFELLLGRWWVLGPSSIFRVSYTKGCWIANGWHGACGRQAWSLGNISFFLLLLLDPSWNTNFMLIILSIRFLFLCVLLIQTQKVVFPLGSFGAKYKKRFK